MFTVIRKSSKVRDFQNCVLWGVYCFHIQCLSVLNNGPLVGTLSFRNFSENFR